ncbi:MAG: sarcosine oxidase subunit gamma [Pseudomonadota bacterium]|nr:sarcosine oxidase subunit gamma [Pseudomonadota bacterium]
MTNYRLSPRTAFGASEPMRATIGKATLTERPEFSIASVTARAEQGGIAAKLTSGVDVSGSEFVQTDTRTVFWTGPNQWFVLDDHSTDETLAQTLKADLGAAASVTEQNDGWVVFDLTGEDLDEVLERLCSINLSELARGRAQRTVIEHVGSFVLCLEQGRSYRLLCGRSFAPSFAHAIKEIMVSVNAQKTLLA